MGIADALGVRVEKLNLKGNYSMGSFSRRLKRFHLRPVRRLL